MKLALTVILTGLLCACEKSQDLGDPLRDAGGGADGSASGGTGGRPGGGLDGGAGSGGSTGSGGSAGRGAGGSAAGSGGAGGIRSGGGTGGAGPAGSGGSGAGGSGAGGSLAGGGGTGGAAAGGSGSGGAAAGGSGAGGSVAGSGGAGGTGLAGGTGGSASGGSGAGGSGAGGSVAGSGGAGGGGAGGAGGAVAIRCLPGARRCKGNDAQACADDGLVWVLDQTCATYCAGAGKCALDGLQVTSSTNLDGVVYVRGEVHVYAGATLDTPTGDLTIYADTITVDEGGSVVAAATGRSPAGVGTLGIVSVYPSNCGGTSYGGVYGTKGSYVASGMVWGSITDSEVQPGSPGGDVFYSNNIGGPSQTLPGASGGGVLRFIATSSITVAGRMSADGVSGELIACGTTHGSGSGGGILLAAESVTMSGALSTVGGPASYIFTSLGNGSNSSGGAGRIKVLARAASITGATSDLRSQGMLPPMVITSSSHPDQTLAYNDGAPTLALAWARPFPSRQGYYVRLDAATSPPPTASDGAFLSGEATTFPAQALVAGDNYFHIVSVDSQFAAGGVESRFHVRVNTSQPSLSSPSHTNETVWSTNTSPTFTWAFPQGDDSVVGAYYVTDHDGMTVPTASDTFLPKTQKQIVLPALSPGVWVFHLVSVDTQGVLTRRGANYRVNIGPDPGSGAIVGTVTDGPTGLPVGGATVFVNDFLYAQTANSAGQFNLNAIPAGTWQVSAMNGARSVSRTVTVTSGEITTANFTLP